MSPAAIRTVVPRATSAVAILPIVVVLPTPLTPTNSHTFGVTAASRCNVRSDVANWFVIASRNALITSSGERRVPSFTAARNGSSNRVANPIPMSASSNVSSSSSHVASSTRPRPRIDWNALENNDRVFPAFSLTEGIGVVVDASTPAPSSFT